LRHSYRTAEAHYAHPDVVDAAAFARPCKTYDERVETAVRFREGLSLTAKDLHNDVH
jgi:acyl-CoA synthetase (AMP-forming)/AMP-acid ligase II